MRSFQNTVNIISRLAMVFVVALAVTPSASAQTNNQEGVQLSYEAPSNQLWSPVAPLVPEGYSPDQANAWFAENPQVRDAVAAFMGYQTADELVDAIRTGRRSTYGADFQGQAFNSGFPPDGRGLSWGPEPRVIVAQTPTLVLGDGKVLKGTCLNPLNPTQGEREPRQPATASASGRLTQDHSGQVEHRHSGGVSHDHSGRVEHLHSGEVIHRLEMEIPPVNLPSLPGGAHGEPCHPAWRGPRACGVRMPNGRPCGNWIRSCEAFIAEMETHASYDQLLQRRGPERRRPPVVCLPRDCDDRRCRRIGDRHHRRCRFFRPPPRHGGWDLARDVVRGATRVLTEHERGTHGVRPPGTPPPRTRYEGPRSHRQQRSRRRR